jgi:hypothetical protein
MMERHMYNVAQIARRVFGYRHAARHMGHFLDRSGANLTPDIPAMLRGIPEFSRRVNESLHEGLRARVNARLAEGARGTFDVETGWQKNEGANDGAWQVALGGFNFSHSAHVRAVPLPDGGLDVRVYPVLHVFDRYDWRPGQSTRLIRRRGLGALVPGRLREIEDADMAAGRVWPGPGVYEPGFNAAPGASMEGTGKAAEPS